MQRNKKNKSQKALLLRYFYNKIN